MKANPVKSSARQILHWPCSSYHSVIKYNGTTFLSNYPTDLSTPSPQLFYLVRFGHKCFYSSRSYHKNVQFWERLHNCAVSSLFSTSEPLQLSSVRFYLFTALPTSHWRREAVNRNRELMVSCQGIWKHPQRLFSAFPQKPWMLCLKGPLKVLFEHL